MSGGDGENDSMVGDDGALLLVVAACGDDDGSPGGVDGGATVGNAAAGEAQFLATCSACHGPDGMDSGGLGKAVVGGLFMLGSTDAEMMIFLNTGLPATDPENTTGVDMPPKRGNPSLSDQDLQDIVAYLRTLQ